MEIEFRKTTDFKRGTLIDLLNDAYSFDLRIAKRDYNLWKEFDDFFYDNSDIANKYGFITVLNNEPIGFVTWDPRNRPNYVEIGHNCIKTAYKGNGYGKLQMMEAIKRIKTYPDLKKIIVTTDDFLLSAQKMYESVGFIMTERRIKPIPNMLYKNGNIDYEIVLKK